MFGACLDELSKLGEVSPQEARRALERLESLEENKPTGEQVLRYGALGAVSGPAISALGELAAGRKPYRAATKGILGLGKAVGSSPVRAVAGDALKGALTAGAIPLVRSGLDRNAEIGKLNRFMQEYQAEKAPEPEVPIIHKVGGVGQGAAMTVSEYSGPTGGGGFNLVSGLPNKAPPGLQSVVQKAGEFAKLGFMEALMEAIHALGGGAEMVMDGAGNVVETAAALAGPHVGAMVRESAKTIVPAIAPALVHRDQRMLQDQVFKGAELLAPKAKTPGAMLRQAQNVGTSAHNQAPGPSIDQTVGRVQPPAFKAPGMPKLPGWGKPTMGATKATEGVRRAFTK